MIATDRITASGFGRTLAWFANLQTPAGSRDVVITNHDTVLVGGAGRDIQRFDVPNHGAAIGELAARPGFRAGWGRFPDGAEVIYLYDRDDEGFGYACALDCPGNSEWGYAPFGAEGE